MPLIAGSTLLAAGGIPRSPFAQHTFVGGNTTMLRILRGQYKHFRKRCHSQEFDQKIQETLNNLSSAVLLNASMESTTSNQLALPLKSRTSPAINFQRIRKPTDVASRRCTQRGVGNLLFESGRVTLKAYFWSRWSARSLTT
jgi:hypothetical protein